jgi:acyl-CoA thioesterase I
MMNNRYVSKRYAVLSRFFKSLGFITLIWVLALSVTNNVNAASPTRILVLGDSLSAGYGLPASEAFPVKLGLKLRASGHDVKMLNGGVSGDTSAGGRARLNWALADKPHFAIIALGGNDGLRGLDSGAMRDNLDDIIVRLEAAGIGVLLTGMRAPPNIGPDYGKAFNRVFPDLAQKHDVPLYPFFLDGVAAIPALNQRDGIHPNPRGVAVIVDRIMPFVVRLLKGKQKAGTKQK